MPLAQKDDQEMNRDYYVVIMAGGVGTRFWPMSTSVCPKQFIDVMGTGRTMIQQTFDRFREFCPTENVFVVTGGAYKDLVLKQLPELRPDRVLCEPHRKNTAPCIAYANYRIHSINPNAIVVVTPADHVVLKQEVFNAVVHQAADAAASNDWLITLGIKPSYPNTGYGYIQFDPDEAWPQNPSIKKVKLFTEKPGLEMARTFVQSGEFLWNTGLFLWNVQTMDKEMPALLPAVSLFRSSSNQDAGRAEELEVIKSTYASNHYLAIDLFILERCHNVYVQKCDFGWADMGCWNVLHEVEHKDVDGNSLQAGGQALLSGCRDNLIRLPEGMRAVLQGLDGYMVTLKDNLLVICKNDDPNRLRRMNNEAQMKLGDDWV